MKIHLIPKQESVITECGRLISKFLVITMDIKKINCKHCIEYYNRYKENEHKSNV